MCVPCLHFGLVWMDAVPRWRFGLVCRDVVASLVACPSGGCAITRLNPLMSAQ